MVGEGLFVSTFGLETACGTARYTFGTIWMMAGVPLITMIHGLFAVGQAFTLLSFDRVPDAENLEAGRRLLGGFAEVLRFLKTPFRSAGFAGCRGVSGPVLRLDIGACIFQDAREIWSWGA